ncbi:MAG: histidine kinase dimerization/phospho-acceptor domain-containing protein [Synechococcales bacterium]|nr:histidine kinase dimerization/phospho-acceptor domain-containing protein [Synechococcales bacterium]
MYSIQSSDSPPARPSPKAQKPKAPKSGVPKSGVPAPARATEPVLPMVLPKRPPNPAETPADWTEIGQQAVAIAYEMRNPLSVVLNGLSLCQDTPMSERARSRLGLALEGAQQLQHMIDDLLEFARYREQPELRWSELDLAGLITESIDLVSQSCGSTNRCIILKSVLPKVWIQGDADRLKRVFLNLFTYVQEAVPSDQTIRCQVAPAPSTGQVWVQIHARKTPVSPHRLQQLLQHTETAKSDRIDIRLLAAQQIIEAHSGQFYLQSCPIRGTTASIQLPIC